MVVTPIVVILEVSRMMKDWTIGFETDMGDEMERLDYEGIGFEDIDIVVAFDCAFSN